MTHVFPGAGTVPVGGAKKKKAKKAKKGKKGGKKGGK